jgi:hypothetical protein
MPWRVTSPMYQRQRFVLDAEHTPAQLRRALSVWARAPHLGNLERVLRPDFIWAGSMNEIIAFMTAEVASNANDTCYPSGDNTCYPSAETQGADAGETSRT